MPKPKKSSQVQPKPVKLHKIPPLIKTSAEWRLYSDSKIISIHKYRPKMLSKIHITHFECDEIKNFGTLNLRRALIAAKSISSLTIDELEYPDQNAWQLERILSFTNHLKALDFCFTGHSKRHFNAEAIKGLPRIGRYRNLRKLNILLDVPVNIKNKVLKGLREQIPRLPKLKILALKASHSYTGWSQHINLNASILRLKPPRSLLSLRLDFTGGIFLAPELQMFTQSLKTCHLLESLALNCYQANCNMSSPEAFVWASCFKGMKKLKNLTFYRRLFPNQQLEGTKWFLLSLSHLQNLSGLNLGISTGSEEIRSFPLLYTPYPSPLKSLDLTIYNFESSSDASLRVFLTNLRALTQLEKLRLKFPGCSNVDDPFLRDISYALEHMKNLKNLKLHLIADQITQEGIIPFAQALKLLVNLTTLEIELKESNLNSKSLQILANSIANRNLTFLSLIFSQPKDPHSNFTPAKGIAPLFAAIAGFKELTYLTLHLPTFKISNKEVKSFSTALKKFKKLETLCLKFSQFDSTKNNFDGLYKLMSSLVSLASFSDDKEKKNLTWLKLVFAGGEFSEKEISEIISSLGKCDSVEFLHLKFKEKWHINKNSYRLFQPKCGSFASLKNAILQFDQFSFSENEKYIPYVIESWESLKNLKDLVVLDHDVPHLCYM